jgi:hypothetical protein
MEVMEAAYDISCPDSTCDKQGILALQEIESLVSTDLMEKHIKFRLDKGKKIYFLNSMHIIIKTDCSTGLKTLVAHLLNTFTFSLLQSCLEVPWIYFEWVYSV